MCYLLLFFIFFLTTALCCTVLVFNYANTIVVPQRFYKCNVLHCLSIGQLITVFLFFGYLIIQHYYVIQNTRGVRLLAKKVKRFGKLQSTVIILPNCVVVFFRSKM